MAITREKRETHDPSEMENASRPNKSSLSRPSSRHKRSGYEPSDTETDWLETPWHNGKLINNRSKTPDPARTFRSKTPDPSRSIASISSRSKTPDPSRTLSPLNRSRRFTSKEDNDSSRTSPAMRRHSRSPYKPSRYGDDGQSVLRRNTSSLKVSEHRSKNISPYRPSRAVANDEINEHEGSFRKRNQRTPSILQNTQDTGADSQAQDISRMSERSRLSGLPNHSRSRSISAPKPRVEEEKQDRRPSPLAMSATCKESERVYDDETQYEPNERIANMKLSESPLADSILMRSTESISLGDIFISRIGTAPEKVPAVKNTDIGSGQTQQLIRGMGSFNQKTPVVTVSTVLSQTNTSTNSSNGRSTNYSGRSSDTSGKLSKSSKKFTVNRQRLQPDTWLSCMRRGSCNKSKSPDSRAIDEASLIERAIVVEELRPFWADKHSPRSLSKFICHKQEALYLKQLVSNNNCPNLLFKGPSGSGKKSLSTALLRELFGDSLKTTNVIRHFQVQETRTTQFSVPMASSPHHVELNLKSESKNARYTLMALAKELTDDHSLAPEVSEVIFKADYKVIVLYDVDKVAHSVQHLIKWIMDRYSNACKIFICCEDDAYILDAVKARCKLITMDAPVTHEIMEVLIQTAKKESFELPVSFAARIATKSKQNLRKAIMALEACKAHNYPFVDEQPIPLGWEEVVMEVAAEILADPSTKRLFFVRGKFQKLLVEFVQPKLILQKLVELFLNGVETGLKRELYYWHSYYEKRLPIGTSALLKLEEFVAKFMGIYRKSSAPYQQYEEFS